MATPSFQNGSSLGNRTIRRPARQTVSPLADAIQSPFQTDDEIIHGDGDMAEILGGMEPRGDWIAPGHRVDQGDYRTVHRTVNPTFGKAFTSRFIAHENAATERMRNKLNQGQTPTPTNPPQPNPSDPFSVYGNPPVPEGYTTGPPNNGMADRARAFNPFEAFGRQAPRNPFDPFQPGGVRNTGNSRYQTSISDWYKSRYIRGTPDIGGQVGWNNGITPEMLDAWSRLGIQVPDYLTTERFNPEFNRQHHIIRATDPYSRETVRLPYQRNPLSQMLLETLRGHYADYGEPITPQEENGIFWEPLRRREPRYFNLPDEDSQLWRNEGRFFTQEDIVRLGEIQAGRRREDGTVIPESELERRRTEVDSLLRQTPGYRSDPGLTTSPQPHAWNNEGSSQYGYYFNGRFYPHGSITPFPQDHTPLYYQLRDARDWRMFNRTGVSQINRVQNPGPTWLDIINNGREPENRITDRAGLSNTPFFFDHRGVPNARPSDSDYQFPEGHWRRQDGQPGYLFNQYNDVVTWNPPLPQPDRPLPQGWRYEPGFVIDQTGKRHAWPYSGPPSRDNPPNPIAPPAPRQNPRPPLRLGPSSRGGSPQSDLAQIAPPPTYTVVTNPGGTLNNRTPSRTLTMTQPELDAWLDEMFGHAPSNTMQWNLNQAIASITPSAGAPAASWHGNPLAVASGQLSAQDVAPQPGGGGQPGGGYSGGGGGYSGGSPYSPGYSQSAAPSMVSYYLGNTGPGLYGSGYGSTSGPYWDQSYYSPSSMYGGYGSWGDYLLNSGPWSPYSWPTISGLTGNSMIYPPTP